MGLTIAGYRGRRDPRVAGLYPPDGPVTYVPGVDSQGPVAGDSGPTDSNDSSDSNDSGPSEATTYDGLTVFLTVWPTDEQAIVAVEMDGTEAWRFTLPEELQGQGAGDGPVTLSDFQLLPDGNLLFSVNPVGVFEMDRDGNEVWSHLTEDAGHDVDLLPNDNVLLAHTWADKGSPQIAEYTRDGEMVWSWDGLDAYEDHELFRDVTSHGWMHITGARRMDDGSTWMCVRNFNAVVRVSAEGELLSEFLLQTGDDPDIVATEGTVLGERPHGCEWISGSRFLVTPRRPDRMVDVRPQEENFAYGEPDLQTIRDADLLPNGNYLITGHDRIVEISSDGEKLWEYLLPETDPPWDVTFHPMMTSIRVGEAGLVDRD